MPQKKALKRKRLEFVSSQHIGGSGRFTTSSVNRYQRAAQKAREAAAKAKEAVAVYHNDKNAIGYGVFEFHDDNNTTGFKYFSLGQYIGQLRNGVPDGFGVCRSHFKETRFGYFYEGQWRNGICHGFGIRGKTWMKNRDGEEWIDDGEEVIVELTEGQWSERRHLLHADCVITENVPTNYIYQDDSSDIEILHTKVFECCIQSGPVDHIIIRYDRGDVFEGFDDKNIIDSNATHCLPLHKGTCQFLDGRVYEGQWSALDVFYNANFDDDWGPKTAENGPEGYGVMRYPDGSVYEGEWKDGKKNGQGKLMRPNAPLREEEWKDGELVDYQEPFDTNDEDENW
jgi:hypothetical protein